MVPETIQSGSLHGAGELLSHLRRHPEDLRRSPADLAATFGLSDSFVRTVLEGVQIPKAVPVRKELGIKRAVANAKSSVREAFERLNRRPVALTIGIIVVWAVIVALSSRFFPWRGVHSSHPDGSPGISLGPEGVVEASSTLLALLATFVVFYRQRMGRYPLIAGLTAFIAASVLFAPVAFTDKSEHVSQLAVFALGEIGWFFIIALYVGLGSLVAVAGAGFHMRRQRTESGLRSRHQLLTRYFEIEQRLQQASAASAQAKVNPLIASAHRHPYIWAFSCSLIFTIATRLVMSMVMPKAFTGLPPLGFMLFGIFASIIQMGLWISLTYLAGKPGRAAITSLCWSAAGLAFYLFPALEIPTADSKTVHLSALQTFMTHIGGALLNALIAAIIGLGATVQRQAQRDRLLARNDPATLMAELLQIQYALSEGEAEVCVLVVDAVKSSLMKSTMDPLIVEYSFRAYQAWVGRVCEAHNGRVYTSTGDGAIVAFGTCGEALLAAYGLQGDVPRFNAEENRLKTPFQLRIGLHVGAVVAGLEKVEFTQVIDIAAHVEHVAPVGGVALTDEVVQRLAGYHFDPHMDDVDGHRVLVARNLSAS